MAQIAAAQPDLKWAHMSAAQKLTWWGKLLVAVLTFGFAYPRVMEPHLRDE